MLQTIMAAYISYTIGVTFRVLHFGDVDVQKQDAGEMHGLMFLRPGVAMVRSLVD